jgi:hypothetical protein
VRGNKGNREGLILLLVVGIAFLFGSVGCEKETIKVKADIYIVKVDSSGNVKGTNIISRSDFDYANSITQSRDEGYAVAVYTREGDSDIRIMKLDSEGEIQWRETIGGYYDDEARSIIQSSDGGYVVAGYATFSFRSTDRVITDVDMYVVKLGSLGEVQWKEAIGEDYISTLDSTDEDSYNKDVAYSIIQSSDGGYVVAGYTSGYTKIFRKHYSYIYVVKLGSLGKVQWEKIIGRGSDDAAYSIIQSSDGGYVVAGYTRSFGAGGSDVYVVKLDSEGKVQWEKVIGGGSDDVAYSIIQSSDGGYVVAGYTRSFGAGGSDVYVVKLDSEGKVQWEKVIGGGSDDVAYSIIQSSDGDYVVAGYTRSFGAGGSDVYVVKLDSEGKVQWEKVIGGGSDDVAYSIIQSSDGCYVIAGYTASFVREDNIYIEKTGSFVDTCWSQGITNYSASSGGVLVIQCFHQL